METKRYPEFNRVYKHYKGGTYEVLTLAKHTETGEDLVIYFSREFGSVHARPLSQWFDKITVSKETESNRQVERFELYNGGY